MELSPAAAAALRLTLVSGVGPRTLASLLEFFGSAEAVLAAPASELRAVPKVGTKLAQAIVAARSEIDVAALVETCRRKGISIVSREDEGYPRSLQEIHDPPLFLYVRGAWQPRDEVSIGIVGARHATSYGIEQAERLASSLARAGVTVVSGLARGIDGAAHRAALAAGGRTIAVLASGVAAIYPPEHDKLADQVAAGGALMSENPPHAAPMSGAFPQRNRIISGVSLGIVVVEAGDRSGALITAKHAMEQGREVFAVPGRVDSRMSRGCHQLIRDGAKLVQSADDILEELGPLVEPTQSAAGAALHHPAELLLNEIEQQVLSAIEAEPTSIDAVVSGSGLPTPQVLSTISVLEMRRLIRRVEGNRVRRV